MNSKADFYTVEFDGTNLASGLFTGFRLGIFQCKENDFVVTIIR
jgi:hypothetical protein